MVGEEVVVGDVWDVWVVVVSVGEEKNGEVGLGVEIERIMKVEDGGERRVCGDGKL